MATYECWGGVCEPDGTVCATPGVCSTTTLGNQATGYAASVAGGLVNLATGYSSSIGGGQGNRVYGETSCVAGGLGNSITGLCPYGADAGKTCRSDTDCADSYCNTFYQSFIGGGASNTVMGGQAVVAGGLANTATWNSNVGGGSNNRAGKLCVGGSQGGQSCAYAEQCSGGTCAGGDSATVAGGQNNHASGFLSTIGGGGGNDATGDDSAIVGGASNDADGDYSIVAGGRGNAAGGDYSFAGGRQAKVRTAALVGSGTTGDQGTFIWADSTAANFTSSGNDQFLIRASGGVGIGTTTATAPRAQLDVVKSGNTVAVFDRTTSDGTIISLQRSGSEKGTISVAGEIVSYNAFTGSHYAWTDHGIDRGSVVVMTGRNRSLHDREESETLYGVAPSDKPNDPRCLGAYLGVLEPEKPASLDNPHQIMAVGNGDMWVVDTGRNIEPGQYLISSDLKGHAMLDDEARFPVGYVIARAGEPVDWANASDTVDGHKHKRISVFFESFERGSAVAVGKSVVAQQSEIDALKSRVASLEHALSANVQPAHPVSLASIGVFAIPALALLGFVGLIVRGRTQNGGGR